MSTTTRAAWRAKYRAYRERIKDPSYVPNPKAVAGGKAAAETRWGPWPHRIIRLDELDPETRDLVVSIVRARRNAAAATSDGTAEG